MGNAKWEEPNGKWKMRNGKCEMENEPNENGIKTVEVFEE